MSQQNKDLVRRWMDEVWNEKRESAIDEMLVPDAKVHGFPVTGGTIVGTEAFKAVHRAYCGAMPDAHVTIHHLLGEGNEVAVGFTATGTHLGDHLGVPASGNRVVLYGAGFARVENGMLAEVWNYIDMGHFQNQLLGKSA
jgi:steroid delta-isomerase-like uncharacterized protein